MWERIQGTRQVQDRGLGGDPLCLQRPPEDRSSELWTRGRLPGKDSGGMVSAEARRKLAAMPGLRYLWDITKMHPTRRLK